MDSEWLAVVDLFVTFTALSEDVPTRAAWIAVPLPSWSVSVTVMLLVATPEGVKVIAVSAVQPAVVAQLAGEIVTIPVELMETV
jgi:hypothetical protein